jgi:hypothetical protein
VERAERRASEPAKKTKGNWSEKLAKMREEYPNAFRPWQEADDERLRQLFDDGKGVKEMTGVFGRHPGSIRARIKKHYGDEVKIPR